MTFTFRNAKDLPLNTRAGEVPQMDETIMGYFQPMTLKVVTKTVVNGFVKESASSKDGRGVIVPTSQFLRMKAEGQRAWATDTLYCNNDIILTNDDVFTYLGVSYRVLDKFNYSLYGFVGYSLTQDYTGAGPT